MDKNYVNQFKEHIAKLSIEDIPLDIKKKAKLIAQYLEQKQLT